MVKFINKAGFEITFMNKNAKATPPQADTPPDVSNPVPIFRSKSIIRYLLVAALLIVIIFGGYLGYQKFSSSSINKKQEMSNSDWQVLDVVLTIDAPLSRAALVINNEGKTLYVAIENDEETAREDTTTPLEKVKEIENLIMKNDFRSLKDISKQENDPEGGATYTIVLGGKQVGEPDGENAFVHRVSCYEFSCEPKFLEIKDKIIEAWGKDILEIGV